ncbi:hypothetical protein MLD38_017619 [Melastoma candidum]|uniref:Uncharacterized protein n=1 Tax=Melastoma candidum TaxID=119954 RepID=A0ACB9QQE0_9MYRT|nr:hypothetical protein MLD38_017619 [Melastoma candidum]
MKGRFLKKLNFISSLGRGLVGQLNHSEKEKLSDCKFLSSPVLDEPAHEDSDRQSRENNEEDELSSSLGSLETASATDEDIFLEPEFKEVHLSEFPEKCPPGGRDSVVFYSTSLRGIRKTFEDCTAIRFLLRSFKIQFSERDVSLHNQYRDELREVLEGVAIPPKLFIRGRYIGGAEQVVTLHEQGKLKKLLEGVALEDGRGGVCGQCAGVRFIICTKCNGSCKITSANNSWDEAWSRRCPECNENGLIKCRDCNR